MIFSDGVESDYLAFDPVVVASISVAEEKAKVRRCIKVFLSNEGVSFSSAFGRRTPRSRKGTWTLTSSDTSHP